jgi:dTDP-4-dehydrorhamnose reductase
VVEATQESLVMKWLITGGSGQLGLAMQKELSTQGIDFIAANSNEVDITKPLIVNQFVDFIKPDVIINSAAWTDVDGAESNESAAYSVNALGPQNLAIAASKIGARLVQVSTDYVFSGENTTPWSENAAHNPQSVYGTTKSEGERFVQATLPSDSYVVRTAWLYSAEGKNFAKTMTKLALNSTGEVKVVNDQFGQPTFTGDLAKQIVDLVLSGAPVGIYHGTNSGKATWFEFAQEIFKLAGADVSRVKPVSTSEYPRPANRPAYSILGHDAWAKTTVSVMRDWQIAFSQVMPAIICAVKAEG